MMDSGVDVAQLLPIDIAYAKLGDWLVDRKKLPSDWRKRLVPIQARILAALSSLPSSADSWTRTLTSDSTGYLEAKRVRDFFVSSTPDARGLFGRLSGTAGEWDAIVKAYEKDFLYLGDAVQIIVQNVNYEIPYQKKQIAKLQQQLADLDHKEAEFKRNAAASTLKYQQACQEFGILGINLRAELLGLSKSLPRIFAEITDAICSEEIGKALELYQSFVAYAHTKPQVQTEAVLPTLRELRTHPNIGEVQNLGPSECTVESIDPSIDLLPLEKAAGQGDQESTVIDWNVVPDNSEGAEIIWDVEGSGFELGESIMEIVEDSTLSDAATNLQTEKTLLPDPVEISWDLGDGETAQGEVTEISWDIDVQDANSAANGTATLASETGLGEEADQVVGGNLIFTTPMVRTEYRNSLLNDLFELKAFLKQRMEEMQSDESAALQDQVRALAPDDVQQQGSESVRGMVQSVAHIIDMLMNDKTRSLIMILTSSRFLDRLEASLKQKKQTSTKLSESLSEFDRKRLELRNTLTTLWPKQEAALNTTKEAKSFVETALSSQYGGRRVNIIGEINTVLGYA